VNRANASKKLSKIEHDLIKEVPLPAIKRK